MRKKLLIVIIFGYFKLIKKKKVIQKLKKKKKEKRGYIDETGHFVVDVSFFVYHIIYFNFCFRFYLFSLLIDSNRKITKLSSLKMFFSLVLFFLLLLLL